MSELTTKAAGGDLALHVPPEERGYRIVALEAAERHARKLNDVEALRKAVEGRLVEQADASRDYQDAFPHGSNQHSIGHNLSEPLTADEWCAKLGKSPRTVRRWADFQDESTLLAKRDQIVQRGLKLMDGDEAANFSSESNEWYTPSDYIDAVRELYGGAINLDPATCPAANETVQAAEIFTAEDDALQHEWHGCAFLNPPYGKDGQDSMAGKFCNYAIGQYEKGNLEACVILVNSVHSQKWQAPLYDYPVCFVDHRIQFVNGAGEENKNPTFQNVFVYLGRDVGRFVELFSPFGYVMGKL